MTARASIGEARFITFSSLVARILTLYLPIGLLAYDCVRIIVVRDGSAILLTEFGQTLVKVGDVIVLIYPSFQCHFTSRVAARRRCPASAM